MYWIRYENSNQAGRFSEAQLAEIRKVTFSRVICQNSDTITELPRSVFDLPHNFLNPRVPCRSLPQLDLNPWRDQQTTSSCTVLSKTIALGASSLVSPCTSCTCTVEGVISLGFFYHISITLISNDLFCYTTGSMPESARQLPAVTSRSGSRRRTGRQRLPRPVRLPGQPATASTGTGTGTSATATTTAAAATAATATTTQTSTTSFTRLGASAPPRCQIQFA